MKKRIRKLFVLFLAMIMLFNMNRFDSIAEGDDVDNTTETKVTDDSEDTEVDEEEIDEASYPAIELHDRLPWYAQKEEECGIASVAMIEAYYFYYTRDKYDTVYNAVKEANGNHKGLTADMLNNKYHDMRSGNSNLERIYNELKAGNPVLVYRTGCTDGAKVHWSVIIDYVGSSSKLEESGFKVYNTQTTWTYSVQNLTEWRHGGTLTHLKVRGKGVLPNRRYKLYLDPNGGILPNGSTSKYTVPTDLVQYEGELWTIKEYTPTRSGYTFEGWYDAATGGVRVYNSEGSNVGDGKYWYVNYIGDQNLTLYAHWKSNDTTKPTIKNAKITNLTSAGYTVECEVTDNVGVAKVVFPTWTDKDGQDDINSDWGNKCKATSVNGNTYYYDVKISDHNNERGAYTTHIYAYDAAGNYVVKGLSAIVPVYVSGITISPATAELTVGESISWSASVTPADATRKDISWSSSDDSIALVNDDGVVTAVKAGNVTITAKAKDEGGKSATCVMTVLSSKGVKGDLTGDGNVAMGDVVKIARAVGGYITLTPEEQALADVTGDGKVAMGDVVKIARYVGGYIDAL